MAVFSKAMRAGVSKRPAQVVSKKPAARGLKQRAKHENIVVYLERELVEWAEAADDGVGVQECPICGRAMDRKWNMQRHIASHTSGKLSCLVNALKSGEQVQHPVFMEVVRALYNHDQLTNSAEPGRYAARAKSLLSKWLGFTTSVSDNA